MLQITSRELPVNVDQATSILEQNTQTLGVFIDLDRTCAYYSANVATMRNTIKRIREMSGDTNIIPTQNESMQSIYLNRFGVPRRLMEDKYDRDKLSAGVEARKRILESTETSEDAKEFSCLHQEYRTAQYQASYLTQYMELPILKMESVENHRMVLARPEWSALATGRQQATKPSIQNIDRDTKDILTHPKGTILVFSDSGQIEPRINFSWLYPDPIIKDLIMRYRDAYYGLLHYCTLDDYTNLIPITPEIKNRREHMKTAVNAASYGSEMSEVKIDADLAEAFKVRIQQHPMRLAYEQKLQDAISKGVEKFYTFFGSEIIPRETDRYKKGTPGWPGHLFRCGLNNPVQGTASDLMNLSVYTTDKLIKDRAKSSMTKIAMYNHDSGMWYVDESDVDLIPELGASTGYQVMDWIPIEAEWNATIRGNSEFHMGSE